MLKGSLRGLERTSEGLGRPQCTRVPWGAYRVPLGYRECVGGGWVPRGCLGMRGSVRGTQKVPGEAPVGWTWCICGVL